MINLVIGCPCGKSRYISEHKQPYEYVVDWETFYCSLENRGSWFSRFLQSIEDFLLISINLNIDLWIELYTANPRQIDVILKWIEMILPTKKPIVKIIFLGKSDGDFGYTEKINAMLREEQEKMAHAIASVKYYQYDIEFLHTEEIFD